MPDRDAPHKNPARVPMVLQVMDDRTAHHEPVHLLTKEGRMANKIEKDGIYKDDLGNQFFMAAGDTTTRDLEYVGPRGQARKVGPAPENKAKPAAPENRAKKDD